MIRGTTRDGDEIELDFDDYTESVLPKEQQLKNGDLHIASGWNGHPVYWNHKGQYLDGMSSPHELDLIAIDGREPEEYLRDRRSSSEGGAAT